MNDYSFYITEHYFQAQLDKDACGVLMEMQANRTLLAMQYLERHDPIAYQEMLRQGYLNCVICNNYGSHATKQGIMCDHHVEEYYPKRPHRTPTGLQVFRIDSLYDKKPKLVAQVVLENRETIAMWFVKYADKLKLTYFPCEKFPRKSYLPYCYTDGHGAFYYIAERK